MSHSVRRHLRLDIDEYDATIRRFIPGYEEMIATAARAVAAGGPEWVLDLGAGTGALAGAVLDLTEDTTVELLDVDEVMLGRARVRLSRFGDRARFTVGSFDEPLSPCDAVMASLALHHVPTLEAKAGLFGRAHQALRPGGVLVNADVTMPAIGPGRDDAYQAWADHLVSGGMSRQEAFDHFAAWSSEDTYFPMEAELEALGAAGFESSCPWRRGVSTVVVGRRL
ncbi:MAG: class I SAM-dependent methyltransferase [Gemmatimonadota bacterium]